MSPQSLASSVSQLWAMAVPMGIAVHHWVPASAPVGTLDFPLEIFMNHFTIPGRNSMKLSE